MALEKYMRIYREKPCAFIYLFIYLGKSRAPPHSHSGNMRPGMGMGPCPAAGEPRPAAGEPRRTLRSSPG